MDLRRKQFTARVWSKLVLWDKAEGLLKKGDRILAAVSGGPDSVCLAHFLAVLSRRKKLSVSLLHVHHGLRGKSADRDAAFVQRLGNDLGLPVRVVQVKVTALAQAQKRSLEDAARRLRYQALIKEARRLRCNKVATGHHLDDQAETVLLHLLRSSRLGALGAMAPKRRLAKGVALIRPLLPLRRTEVLAYLKIHGLKYRLDHTNQDDRFTRNWIRLKVLPLLESHNPKIRERLASFAAQVRRQKID